MKRQLALALMPALLVLVSLPAWGSDGDIIWRATLLGTTDQAGYECDFWNTKWNNGKGNSPFGACYTPVITVYAELKGASAGGITGIEWSADYNGSPILPPGYAILPLPLHTANNQLGNAFFSGGENLAWNACQTADMNGRIPLYTIITFPTAPCGPSQRPPELTLTAGGHLSPSNPFYRCPLFTLCDGPTFTKVCLGDDVYMCERQQPPFPMDAFCSSSGTFTFNGTAAGVGQCTPPPGKLAASPKIDDSRTWGNVKALYR